MILAAPCSEEQGAVFMGFSLLSMKRVPHKGAMRNKKTLAIVIDMPLLSSRQVKYLKLSIKDASIPL